MSYSDANFLLEHGQNGKHPILPAQEYLRGLPSPEMSDTRHPSRGDELTCRTEGDIHALKWSSGEF